MKIHRINHSRAGFGFIEILLVLATVCVIYYLAMNLYFKKAPFGKETEKILAGQGIDTSSPKTIIDTVKGSLQRNMEQEEKRAKELEGMR